MLLSAAFDNKSKLILLIGKMYLERFSYFDTLHNKDLTFDCLSLFLHSLVPRLIATCKITFLTINFSQFFFHQKACAVSCFLHHFPPYPLHRRGPCLGRENCIQRPTSELVCTKWPPAPAHHQWAGQLATLVDQVTAKFNIAGTRVELWKWGWGFLFVAVF